MQSKFLILLFMLIISLSTANAEIVGYKGVDPTQNNHQNNINDNSIEKPQNNNFYYGYKLSTNSKNGFFVAPEISLNKNNNVVDIKNNNQNGNQQNSNQQNSSQPSIIVSSTTNTQNINQQNSYIFKTNIGYDFNRHFSAFISYNVANLTIGNIQSSPNIMTNNFNRDSLAIGSQINISNNFGIKLYCSNQQIINNANNQQNSNQNIGCNNLKIGTVYGF
jgi:hypothetical protein